MVEKGHLPISNAKCSLLLGYKHVTTYILSKIEFLPNSFFISNCVPYNTQ